MHIISTSTNQHYISHTQALIYTTYPHGYIYHPTLSDLILWWQINSHASTETFPQHQACRTVFIYYLLLC